MNATWLKIIVAFILISLPARCVGEWRTERDRVAYVEEHSTPQIAPIIPDCALVGMAVYFVVDSRGLVHYRCGGAK